MAKAQQEKDRPRTQIVVAMIAAAGVIVAGVIGAIGSVVSNKSNGDGREETAITSPTPTRQQSAGAGSTATASADAPSIARPESTMVYVTSVSTAPSSSLTGPNDRDQVTWKFAGTVRPSPEGWGAVFVLGTSQDGSQDVNSAPVPIAFDGSWVAVVGPIKRDLAWKMIWTATYGIAPPRDGDPVETQRVQPRPVPSDRTRLILIAKTNVPKNMLPPRSP